jgi:PAS domain S-box-containing protein
MTNRDRSPRRPRDPPPSTGAGAEHHLDDPQRFAEAVLATLRQPLLVLDAALRVELANGAFYRAFRGTPDATIGQRVYEVCGGVFNSPALRTLLEAVLPQNTSFDDFTLSIDVPPVGRRVLLLNARRLYREGQRTEKILLALDDVTERHRATELQAELAAIVGGSDDAILSNALDGTIRSWNQGAERLYGYAAGEAVGKSISLIVPPDRRAELTTIHERLARGERVPPFVTEHIRKDGSRVEVSLTISPIRDAAGRVTGAAAMARDVTEQLRIERSLHETARLLENISFASPAVLYTLNVHADSFLPAWVSTNVTAILGYTVPEALAADWWANHLHPEDRDACVSRRATLLRTGHLAHEYRFLRKDGSVVWVREESRAVRDAAGRPQQVVGAWLDITERRALEEQFLQAQKMESIGRLAGGVAHDFNNLLTVIVSTADLAAAGFQQGDPLVADLREIRQAAERGAALTRQLLAFSRRQVFQPQVVQLNDTLTALEPMLRRLLGEDIRLVIVPGPALGNVRVDPAQMQQVLMNLLVNGRDAMPNGGVLTIETANVELDDAYVGRHFDVSPGVYVMLAVSDTGVGMDAATRQRVFEPFFTTKPAGRGTGLGLSTVYGIVKQSGGHVWVYSEPGVGTTFKIYLPRTTDPVTSVQPPRPAAPAQGSETILLVDDDESLREVSRRALNAAGYTVLPAGTAGEALLAAERFHGQIGLLLTDVVMPTMRGPELAHRVSQLHPEIRVLYMSGYPENAIVHEGQLVEGAFFLSKPFDPATLTRRVREVLDMPT